MRIRSALLLPILLVILALVACSDRPTRNDDATAVETPAGSATTESGSPSATATGTAGDGTATPDDEGGEPLPDDLRRVLDEVADLRELDAPDDIEVEFITRAELPATYDSVLTDDDLEDFDQATTLYRLIGYIENDQDYRDIIDRFIAIGVAGFYVPDEDKLWVVVNDGDTEFDQLPLLNQVTLAHEFVHAVQDRAFDLDKIRKNLGDGLDPDLAFLAIVEGDAETFSERGGAVYLARIGSATVAFNRPAGQFGIPEAIMREQFFPYLQGPPLVASIVDRGGTERLNDLITRPPVASSQILHPELLDDPEWSPVEVTLPDLAGTLGDGWEIDSEGTFGEFELSNYLQLFTGRGAAAGAAAGWAGDHYAVYSNGTDSAALFRIEFASEDEAQEFADAHSAAWGDSREAQPGGYSVAEAKEGDVIAIADREGTTVTYAFGSTRDLAVEVIESAIAD
jgi:hypothetical protein